MGCSSGKLPEADVCGGGGGGGGSGHRDGGVRKEDKLLDKYALGKVLGQGAFGVVYSCKKKATREEFAVKMIDQVETPVAEIKLEVDMLRKLAHPCIVKLHDVYYEKVFVCMVLELYRGGDMIEGMQLHWQTKGMIPEAVCQNMSKMMFQSVQWLHQNNVIHRDLKGDNYLQDRKDIENPGCRIYLSDFGTVIDLPPAGRMKQRCGTKTYWSPEFFGLDYGLKVDVWALGVVIFGMVTGRFPFKGEDDVRKKTVKAPSRVCAEGGDFVLRTLDKVEASRVSAKQALEHTWLSSITSAADKDVQKLDPSFGVEIREKGVHAGVKERRRELVERLQGAQMRRPSAAFLQATKEQLQVGFEVLSERLEATIKFQWWSAEKVKAANFFDESKAVRITDHHSESTLFDAMQVTREMFEAYGIATSNFGQGKAKKLTEFVHEVQSGQARLMLDASRHKNLVRVVDVVLLRIVHGEGVNKRYLVKTGERYPDGRTRSDSQLVGIKKLPHENGIQTARRLVRERIEYLAGVVKLNFAVKECFEEDEDSPSYPGVRTVYRKEIYEGAVTTTDQSVLAKIGLLNGSDGRFAQEDSGQYTRYFTWLTEPQCVEQHVKLAAPQEGFELSALVAPPIGYEEDELLSFLQASNVDITQFGKDGVKSLAEFSEELVKGESTLVKQADGTLIRVVEVVILQIFNEFGGTLVEVSQMDSSGLVKETNRLPAVKRRTDENPFWAGHRVMSQTLHLSENLIEMDPDNVRLVEDRTTSKAYAGLPTIYSRRIIPCKVNVAFV